MVNLRALPGLTLERTKSSWLALLITGALAGCLMVGMGLLARRAGVGVRELTQDAAWTAGVPFYYGALGSAGVLLWWTGGVVCLFAAALLGKAGGGRASLFLWCSGLFTLLLAADDQFQLHEVVLPVYAGIGEMVVFGVYGLLGVAYLVAFLPTILRSDFPLLGAAVACLAFSIAYDLLVLEAPGQHLVEDGSKTVGIALWTVYYVRTSFAAVRAHQPAAEAPAQPPCEAAAAARLSPASRV